METSGGKIATANEINHWMADAHQRTVESVEGLTTSQLMGFPDTPTNPFLWSLGHVAWFYEIWVLRHHYGLPPVCKEGDEIYNSFDIPWSRRWDLSYPDIDSTLDYLDTVERAIGSEMPSDTLSEEESYFHRLGIHHADMHYESNVYFRQTHAFSSPAGLGTQEEPRTGGAVSPAVSGTEAVSPIAVANPNAGGLAGEVEIPGHPVFMLGATQEIPFVYDNEKWAHPVNVKPFRIDRAQVTNEAFQAFVEDGGYHREAHWSMAGNIWREQHTPSQPIYWRSEGGGRWLRREFDRWLPLEPHRPVIHVNWYEAEAYCRWAGRRLPTEGEWEFAASAEPGAAGGGKPSPAKRLYPWGDTPPTPELANLNSCYGGTIDVGALPAGDSAFGCRQMMGNTWEWTSDAFYPYPGFVVDPYKEYSAPWFGNHKVMRGGAWMTAGRLIRNTWRNYFRPERPDIPVGFRTCAL